MKAQIKVGRKYLLCTDSLPMNDRIDHVRELQFRLPKFRSVPNVTITIHSTDSPGNVLVAEIEITVSVPLISFSILQATKTFPGLSVL